MSSSELYYLMFSWFLIFLTSFHAVAIKEEKQLLTPETLQFMPKIKNSWNICETHSENWSFFTGSKLKT